MNARVNEKQVVGRMGLAAGMVVCERYRIQGEVGRGATSVIHAALDIATGVPLALKVLHPRAAANATAVERFLAEARVLARLRHPSIVHVFDYGLLEDGRPFMVMEFLCGHTLQELLEHEGPLDWSRARPLLLSACAALQAVHDAGVVHRDVKPQNLFVLDDDRAPSAVKVLDFGLARDPHEPFTAEGVGLESSDYLLLGTPGFMAPEQVTSSDVDARADVYALGVTMFSMLTGRLPFVSNHPVKQMAEHLYVEPPRPRSLNPSVPAAVERVLLRAIAKDPTQRIPSMRAFRRELEVLDDEGDAYPPLLQLRQVIEGAHEEPALQRDALAREDAELGDAAPGQVVDDDPTPFSVASQSDPRVSRGTTVRRLGITMLSVGLLASAMATMSFGPAEALAQDVANMVEGVHPDALERPAAAPWRPSALAVVPDGKRDTTVAAPLKAEPAPEPSRAHDRRVKRRPAPARVVATPPAATTGAPTPDEHELGATPASTEAPAVEPREDPSPDTEDAVAPAADIEPAPEGEAAQEPPPAAPSLPNEPPTPPTEAADGASSPE